MRYCWKNRGRLRMREKWKSKNERGCKNWKVVNFGEGKNWFEWGDWCKKKNIVKLGKRRNERKEKKMEIEIKKK